jgi:hypothetical protein
MISEQTAASIHSPKTVQLTGAARATGTRIRYSLQDGSHHVAVTAQLA